MKDRGPESGWAVGQRYFALGLKFAGGIIVFVLAGFGLDRWIGTTPLFLVIGTVAGSVLSFMSVYREVDARGQEGQREQKRQKGQKGSGGQVP